MRWGEAERTYRHIWRHVDRSSEPRFPLKRGRETVLILQMAKVASTSIRSALSRRGINALHSHGLSPARQHGALSHLLEARLTSHLVRLNLRAHVHRLAVHTMIRWYREHKEYRGRKLKVITLTRDPMTHYPSAFVHRRDDVLPAILAWHRARYGAAGSIDPAQALSGFLIELAAIIVEGRPSAGGAAGDRCVALARQRWPDHPVMAREAQALLSPVTWFDHEFTPVFGFDALASPELRDRGWTERNKDWVDVLVLKFEHLPALVPEIQRFCNLAELTLPRANVTSGKDGAAEIVVAMRAMLDTPIGLACARELRSSPYGRACGYDLL